MLHYTPVTVHQTVTHNSCQQLKHNPTPTGSCNKHHTKQNTNPTMLPHSDLLPFCIQLHRNKNTSSAEALEEGRVISTLRQAPASALLHPRQLYHREATSSFLILTVPNQSTSLQFPMPSDSIKGTTILHTQ